jgi:hypothetical protein
MLDENKKLIEDTRFFEEEYEHLFFRGFHLDFLKIHFVLLPSCILF